MSDYTPDERRMKIIYVADSQGPHDDDEAAIEAGDEFDGFIAKVKADALREFARELNDEYEERTEKSGAYGQKKVRAALLMASRLAGRRADRIDGEA